MRKRYPNKSSGKHSKALSETYWAEWKRQVPRFDAGELSFEDLNREALKPGAEALGEIRRANLVKAREALSRKRAADQKAKKAAAAARFEAKKMDRKTSKNTDR